MLPAHWEGGARASIETAAVKNPVRPSKGMAEGGFGGNSAPPERLGFVRALLVVGSSKVQNIPPDSTSNFFRGGCLAALRLGLVALRLAQSHIIPRRKKRKGSGLYI